MDKDLYVVLSAYGLSLPLTINQIDNKSVWEINDKYFLKKNDEEEKDIEKIVMINKFLTEQGIPAVEYIKTVSGEYYVIFEDNIYSLMRKINGEHIEFINPFIGDYKNTGYSIGVEMARLHKALKKMGTTAVYESDLMSELKTQLTNIKTENIDIPYEIINSCLAFENEYNLLPKQLIHRDIQFGNILFEKGRLKCFLDFDSSQVNARLFDLAYFGQSILFNNNYRDNKFIIQWINFFSSLLHGYNSENILYENEIKSIHIFCIILQFSFISYYLYSEDKRELVPKRVDLLKWIYANESIFAFSLSFAN